MRHIKIRMPLKNENYTGYSNDRYYDYDRYIGDNENANDFVKYWMVVEGIDSQWPYIIILDEEMTEENSTGLE